MTTIEEAKSDFERLGFEICKHTHYKAPNNNPEEIKKLEAELAEAEDYKSQVILESLLAEEKEEQIETLNATKTFEIFRSLMESRRPYIDGTFIPKHQSYILRFFAEDLGSNDHSLRDAGRLFFDSVVSDARLNPPLLLCLNRIKSNFGLPTSVSFGSMGQYKIDIMPPFFLETVGPKIDNVYRDLVSAVKSLGYNMREL